MLPASAPSMHSRRASARPGLTGKLDDAAAKVLAALQDAGVDALLLKGRALAVLLYAAGEPRGYTDVDLLVAPGELSAAEATLRGLGYVNASTSLGIDDVGGVVHAETWLQATPGSNDQPMIDLHHWLPGARATPATVWDALTRRRTWIEVGGRQVAVLDRAGQAMHLATHAAQHGPAQKHVNELALALERWPADVWDAAAALAQEIDATDAFAAGCGCCPRAMRWPDGSTCPRRPGLTGRYGTDERPRGTFHVQALADARGTRERIRILHRSLLPNRLWIMRQHRWAQAGGLRVIAAYGAHLARAPAWAARAWLFRRRARRAGRVR